MPPLSDPEVAVTPIAGVPRGLAPARIPGSIDEARKLVAYNERVIASSGSRQRRMRAAAMLINLRPHVERLEAEERARLARIGAATPPASTFEGQLQRRVRDREDDEFEVVWDGSVR